MLLLVSWVGDELTIGFRCQGEEGVGSVGEFGSEKHLCLLQLFRLRVLDESLVYADAFVYS